jgi:small-conductance mechanosensitive channel
MRCMSLIHDVWKDTMEVAKDPLFNIGHAEFTLLHLLTVALILLAVWKIAKITERSISKLDPETSDPGVYLLSRMAHYFVWIIGIIFALNFLGFELSSFAFLGGAVGVGLGFGLQNILSNFVAGIIILFEKSLKVDDIVELQSGLAGKVAEINLRFTRITTSDSIDILVPNSEFISGRVVNWTFNNSIRRIHVPFGVAYGTDKALVREAGIAAARSVPTTLDDDGHQPEVILVRMGDNALEFELLVWIDQNRVKIPGTISANYVWALETELVKRNIEIPSPQRELHLKDSRLTVAVESMPKN